MKKIDELFDDFELQHEEIDINEEEITKAEMDKVKELTLIKCGLSQNKRSFQRRFIIPLAAAMTLILSFAVVFAQGGFNNIYYRLFGENIKYVSNMGTVIDKSYSSNGITFNVASMLGDENSFYIVFELIKENGETFENSDYIEFQRLNLQFSSSGGYSWEQIKDDDEKDNKATFVLIGDTARKTVGRNLKLEISNITEYNNETDDGFNPYDFLKRNEEYLIQGLTKNMQKSPTPVNNNMTEEIQEKAEYIYDITPSNILPMKYSNISMEEGLSDITIDNIGFADGKLSIRLASTDSENINVGYIYFENVNDKNNLKYDEYMFTEENDNVKYNYYVFDIKSMEELKNYNLKYCFTKKVKTTKGDWEVSFKANYKNTSNKIKVNKEIEVEGKRYTVKNIKLSPISLNIELRNNIIDNLENSMHNSRGIVSVNMKDGSVLEIGNSGVSTNPLTATMNFIFKQPVDTALIDTVKIGDIEIKVDL